MARGANKIKHFATRRTFGDQVADEKQPVARPDADLLN
jgi:hypothetical protein